jgi:hypothetical protein
VRYNHFDSNQNPMDPSAGITDDIKQELKKFKHGYQILAFHGGGGDKAQHSVTKKGKTANN